jgi:flavorubredoxin
MLKAIEKVRPLPIDTICPGHGPILRSGWKEKLERSATAAGEYLARTKKTNRVLVAYVSAYGYTGEMARIIAGGLKRSEVEVDLLDIEHMLLGDLEEHVVHADAILVGSPTINKNTLLPIYKLFSVINPIRDKGKPAAAFGSFGWSGEAVKLIEDHLKNLKMNVIRQGTTARFLPNEEETGALEQLADELVVALKEGE